MASDLKPLPPRVTDMFVTHSPRIEDPYSKPKNLELDVVNADNSTNDTVNPDTLQVRRTFKDARQAHSAYRRLKQQNVERNRKNQLIQKKLNLEPPYNNKKLESMGQNWRSNRPTGFLSTMVSRIQPPFREIIETSPTLTYSKYPLESVDAENKTKIFREEITKCIRGWKGHDDLLAQTTHENTTFGFCGWVWDDLRDWKPEFLRQDYTFFSIETPQETNSTPIWARKKRYQIFELLPILEKPEISALAGWNIKNLVTSINNAIPAGRTLDADDDARRYEDWIREGSYGASYENDAKYVELGELFVREPHGKISRFLFDDKSGDEICTQVDRYNSMTECLNLFSVEIGSGNLMSSRGAGRDLYNTHVAIEKARNLIIDNVYLRGLLLMKKGPNARTDSPPLTVLHPIAYVNEGYEVIAQQMPADVDDFLKLDQFISGLAEIQVGTFLPGQVTDSTHGGKKTASEVNRVAAIENQLRQGILMRWSRQYSKGVERMQRGICHPEHVKAAADLYGLLRVVRMKEPDAVWARREIVEAFDRAHMDLPAFMVPFEVHEHLDEDAIDCCLKMLDRNLAPADILLMAYSPASELLQDSTIQDQQMLDLIIQRYQGNQNINQDELLKLDLSSKIGEAKANALVLPKDQVEALAIEATRQQVIELQSIMAGQDIPVSPRDNDMVHIQTMTEKLFPIIANAPAGSITPNLMAPLEQAIKHYEGHLHQAEAKGTNGKVLSPYYKALKQAINHLTAGQVQPVNPNVVPAAAPPNMQMNRGGIQRAPRTANLPISGVMEESQPGIVQSVATPPKPPTAA
jgi:hypothetical protein